MAESAKFAHIKKKPLAFWTVIDPAMEKQIGPGKEQVDTTHFVGWSFESRRRDAYAEVKSSAEHKKIYELIKKPEGNTFVSRVTICDGVVPCNSGAHRIIYDGVYKGEKFAVAVEEIEDILCRYQGERIYIGIESETGRKIAEDGGLDFAIEILGAFDLFATGTPFRLATDMRGPNPKSRFQFEIDEADDIRSQGCRLSAAASKCFLKGARDAYDAIFGDSPKREKTNQ